MQKFSTLILNPFGEKLPEFYFIDPSTVCNLHCPLCPNGANLLKQRKFMSFNNFKKIIDKIPKGKFIGLYNWGEPLLNPNIIKMINYAKKYNHYIQISSNLHIKKPVLFFQNLIASKADELILSIDGASQKSYQKYRVGGNFSLVMKNLKILSRLKKKDQTSQPKMIWKFIVNQYNESEIQIAKKAAKKLGVDFTISKMGLGDTLPDLTFKNTIEERKKIWLPKNKKYWYRYYAGSYKPPLIHQKCHYIFDSIFIGPEGEVFPCCYVSDKKYCFGNLLKEDLKKIWNNEAYKSSRRLFKRGKKPTTNNICFRCQTFQKLNS